jgi:NhaA family Na+:H+ antiporter
MSRPTSGIVLMVAAAAIALASGQIPPLAHSYHDLWHLPVSLGIGDFVFERNRCISGSMTG